QALPLWMWRSAKEAASLDSQFAQGCAHHGGFCRSLDHRCLRPAGWSRTIYAERLLALFSGLARATRRLEPTVARHRGAGADELSSRSARSHRDVPQRRVARLGPRPRGAASRPAMGVARRTMTTGDSSES